MVLPPKATLDRYVVESYLAEGGMGAIYLGKKQGAGGFERPVVLKQLLPEYTSQQEFIELFLREARLTATLDHANIIHTIDLVTAGDEYFIVMEFLDGADVRTLQKRAKEKRREFSLAAAIYMAREVLSALHYAHSKVGLDGRPLFLIHRDVSPSNILVSRNGEVKLTDFGIAKAATHHSVFYRVKGKIGYMAPEQARGETLDNRTDLFSLGVCLYEFACGERLFVSENIFASPDEIYGVSVEPLSKKIGAPAELDAVIGRALSLRVDDRYQTASEFQEALLRVAHKHGLMMSSFDLAEHLVDVCGRPEGWRERHGDAERQGTQALSSGTQAIRSRTQALSPGTQVLASTQGIVHTQGIVSSDADNVGLDYDYHEFDSPLVAGMAELSEQRQRARDARIATSITHLHHLRALEFTSLVGSLDRAGSKPLLDLGDLTRDPLRPRVSPPPLPATHRTVPLAEDNPSPVVGWRVHLPWLVLAVAIVAAIVIVLVLANTPPEVTPTPTHSTPSPESK